MTRHTKRRGKKRRVARLGAHGRHKRKRYGKRRRKLTAAQKRARRARMHAKYRKHGKRLRKAWRATRATQSNEGYVKGDHVTLPDGSVGVVEYVTRSGFVGVHDTSAYGHRVDEWHAHQLRRGVHL